jgi:hypothetical protein
VNFCGQEDPAYVVRMILVDFRHAFVSRQNRDATLSFEQLADFLPEQRILAQFCRQDHPGAGQKLFWSSLSMIVAINELFCVDQRAEFLIFDKMRVVGRKKILNYLVRYNPKTLASAMI